MGNRSLYAISKNKKEPKAFFQDRVLSCSTSGHQVNTDQGKIITKGLT